MANKLFSYGNVRNHTSRNGFDLSNKNAFTAKAGELLPVYHTFLLPGDKVNISVSHFTRTPAVETAAFTRIKEYFDFFFVPMRLMWKSFPTAITQMLDSQVSATSLTESAKVTTALPYFTLDNLFGTISEAFDGHLNVLSVLSMASSQSSVPPTEDYASGRNQFGFQRPYLFGKLMSLLGYASVTDDYITKAVYENDGSYFKRIYNSNFAVTPFPLLAYQKIYQDYFRKQEWEEADPRTYNVDYLMDGTSASNMNLLGSNFPDPNSDYWANNTMFDLRYANWNADLIMGLLPKQQLDAPATVSVDGVVDYYEPERQLKTSDSRTLASVGNDVALNQNNLAAGGTATRGEQLSVFLDDVTDGITGQFSILQLREQQALQKWREISLPANHDYVDQIQRHWGITGNKALSYMCKYLGGVDSVLDINEVVNQNLATKSDSADIKGKGVGSGNSKTFSFESQNEYGVLMCIYHAVPLLDYDYTGINGQLLLTDAKDFPIPEFDSIGLQPVTGSLISNSPDFANLRGEKFSEAVIGYAARYVDWKSTLDVINGAFKETLKSWVAPINDKYFYSYFDAPANTLLFDYNYNFLKVNPSILNPIFGVECNSKNSTDQLYVNSFFDCKIVRNLDFNGLPY